MGKKLLLMIFLLVTTAGLFGCSSSIMMKVAPVNISQNDYALVTFLRPSRFGGAIQFGVWDSDNFIGVLSSGSYIQYKAAPGEHTFLARAENWSCVKANLEAGKKYYILGKVFPGVWKARVAFDPILKEDDISDEKINGWLTGMDPTGVIPEKRDTYVTPRLKDVKQAVENTDNGESRCETMGRKDFRP